MKKTYMIPTVEVLNIAPATLIAESIGTGGNYEGGDNDVKARHEDFSADHDRVSNVWDDDWSR